MQRIIHIENGVPRMPQWQMARPVNFSSLEGEHIAIIGPNGGGKSMLVDIIVGRHPLIMTEPRYDFAPSTKPMASENIQYITFRDTYGGDNDRTYFLQQRWNQMEISDDTPTTRERLEDAFLLAGPDSAERRALQRHIYGLFRLEPLLDKKIILLSSGELRKFKLACSLFTEPRVLIMDNPFIGLDSDARAQLSLLLDTLSKERSLQIILVISKSDDLPPFITHVVEVENRVVGEKKTVEEWRKTMRKAPARVLSAELEQAILALPDKQLALGAGHQVVNLHDISIRYGDRTILDRLSWVVREGDCWALSGQNGSGKSTLLSLVCADNPQSYACDIDLFGKPRGSGESIWEIKRHIGYVSPEMHRAYQRDLPAIKIVASGLKDSVGLYVRPDAAELEQCRFWMRVFGIAHLENRTFLKMSSGEQRLVLLARAFVKDPELLVLDEPLHGLDLFNRRLAKDVMEVFCRRRGKTLIIVTHYEEELPACVNHWLRLKAGNGTHKA